MTADFQKLPAHPSRWDSIVWPRWLPVTARMPVVAQITGAVALTALLVGPWWSQIPQGPQPLPASAPVQQPMAAFPKAAAPIRPVTPDSATSRAHLNVDVQHAFGSVDLTVSVDGTPALETTLAGSGKRFKVFGKRAARNFTRTIDLTPGAHIVSVRVRSASDKFDQARVERFDLEPATVAALRISADKSGLSLVAERPQATPARLASGAPAAVPLSAATPVAQPPGPATRQDVGGGVELLQSLRSMLIAIAGFVASAATGFLVQEFLRSRRGLLFDANTLKAPPATSRLRPE